MSTGGNAVRLAALTRDLRGQWILTREQWSDEKSREFEARFLAELETAVHAAETRIEMLEAVLHKLRRDCEPSAGN
jgi:hypothetical protein